jgi:hypothetical protein
VQTPGGGVFGLGVVRAFFCEVHFFLFRIRSRRARRSSSGGHGATPATSIDRARDGGGVVGQIRAMRPRWRPSRVRGVRPAASVAARRGFHEKPKRERNEWFPLARKREGVRVATERATGGVPRAGWRSDAPSSAPASLPLRLCLSG